MARGTTLGELVTMLRVQARYDPNPALSLNLVPLMQDTIRSHQSTLYEQFDWPFLRIRRDKIMAAGQRYYDIPEDLNLERIIQVDIRYGGTWQPVGRGISLDHYSAIDSDADARNDPVRRWEVMDTGSGEQIEVWPVPATDGAQLRFTGIRKLTPLIQNSDRADLDDLMIVYYAAGELLGGVKSPLAELKFQQGKALKLSLQGRVTKKRSNGFILGGQASEDPQGYRRTPLVAYVRSQ